MSLRKKLSAFRVGPDGKVNLARRPTTVKPLYSSPKRYREVLERGREELRSLQNTLYAHNRYALLLIFQGMDTAGKDGAIKHVMFGVNPQGCQVFSFTQPSDEELHHDDLFRVRSFSCEPQFAETERGTHDPDSDFRSNPGIGGLGLVDSDTPRQNAEREILALERSALEKRAQTRCATEDRRPSGSTGLPGTSCIGRPLRSLPEERANGATFTPTGRLYRVSNGLLLT